MQPQPDPSAIRRRVLLLILSVSLVAILLLAGFLVTNLLTGKKPASTSQPTQTTGQQAHSSPTSTAQANKGVSSLLFGTNLGLFTSNDQVITSDATRQMMQQIHVQIIRIPVRTNLPNDIEMQAAQAVKAIGAIPLVVLTGMRDPNVQADDTQIINDMNSVFGNTLVYYEFGNEDDWNGLTIDRYTVGWNQLIPQFKHLAHNGKFIGPVSYQYSHDNLTTFLQGANPRPDAISWHEYTCSYKDPAADCLAHIDNWTTHISDARAVMQSTLGQNLPIMITEWNYAADQSVQSNGQPFPDNKYNNPAFMTAWTTKALQTLAENQVFASMQYSVTNTALPMITYNNTLTTQGTAFQSLYEKMIQTHA